MFAGAYDGRAAGTGGVIGEASRSILSSSECANCHRLRADNESLRNQGELDAGVMAQLKRENQELQRRLEALQIRSVDVVPGSRE